MTRPATSITTGQQWLVVLTSLWFLGGLFLDGWAHTHVPRLETFFTPWHAVFYSGYAAAALALIWLRWRHGRALPRAYRLSLMGAAVFFLGGIGDMAWHQLFGVEADVEALLSPTHLVLATGMTLMVSGPLRQWLADGEGESKPHLSRQLPMLLSLTITLCVLSFMTQFAHPVTLRLSDPAPGQGYGDAMASLEVASYLLQTIIVVAGLLLVLRRGRLAPGATMVVLVTQAAAMALMRDGWHLVVAAAVGGAAGELLLFTCPPMSGAHRRLWATLMPLLLWGTLVGLQIAERGTWFSIHLWAGTAVVTAAAGFLLSGVLESPTQELDSASGSRHIART